MKTPVLTTRRLRLRPLRLSDAPSMQKNVPHLDQLRFINATVPWPYPDDGTVQFLQNVALPAMEAERQPHWAITEKPDPADRHIGSISLRPTDTKNHAASGWPKITTATTTGSRPSTPSTIGRSTCLA